MTLPTPPLTKEEKDSARSSTYFGPGWGFSGEGLVPEGMVAYRRGVRFTPDSLGYLWPNPTIPDWAKAFDARRQVAAWLGFPCPRQSRSKAVRLTNLREYDRELSRSGGRIFDGARD